MIASALLCNSTIASSSMFHGALAQAMIVMESIITDIASWCSLPAEEVSAAWNGVATLPVYVYSGLLAAPG